MLSSFDNKIWTGLILKVIKNVSDISRENYLNNLIINEFKKRKLF